MLLKGSINNIHIVSGFFCHEYAFSMSWKTKGVVIHACHSRGTWYLARLKKNDPMMLLPRAKRFTDIESFQITDTWDWSEETPALISQFLSEIKIKWGCGFSDEREKRRQDISSALSELSHFWGGNLQDMDTLNVLQPGRNVRLDSKTADFIIETGGFDHLKEGIL